MAKTTETTETIHVYDEHHSAKSIPGFLAPDVTLVILTWLSFFALLVALSKIAWKPILEGLEKREEDIRQSLENADRLKNELEQIDKKRNAVLRQADEDSKRIIEDGRKAAIEAGHSIKHKAKEEAQIFVENAQRQISEETNTAYAQLKSDSAEIAVKLASKLIEENLDEEKNRKLIDKIIEQM